MNQAAGKLAGREFNDRVLAAASRLRVLDAAVAQELIRQRQRSGLDHYDEVWEGEYVVPPLPNLPHQNLVTALAGILFNVVTLEGKGQVQAGANVSDRRDGWEHNYRDPDVVIVLKAGRAQDCGTHWLGGPDFLIEVQSPGDETEDKLPFYTQLQVRELLLIQRDTRELRLLRHDGQTLAEVGLTPLQSGRWLVSAVVPVAFRRRSIKKRPRTEVRRTDGKPGSWLV